MQGGDTALTLAAAHGRRDVVEVLVGHGARIDHQTEVILGDGCEGAGAGRAGRAGEGMVAGHTEDGPFDPCSSHTELTTTRLSGGFKVRIARYTTGGKGQGLNIPVSHSAPH